MSRPRRLTPLPVRSALAAFAAAFAMVGGAGTAAAQVPDPGGDASAPLPVPVPGKLFGFNEATVRPSNLTPLQTMGLARTAGANAIRGTVNWGSVEQKLDVWHASTWRPYDMFYANAVTNGLTPVMILGNSPIWARDFWGKLCLSNHTCPYPPRQAMDGEWAEFAAEAARRWPLAIFEIWNEPNLASHWRPSPDPYRYARLQIVAHDAIKRVRPGATVLSGGFANLASTNATGMAIGEYVRKAYSAGLKGHIDGLAFHPYPGPSAPSYTGPKPDLGPDSGFARGFAEMRSARLEADDTQTPLYLTETGISTTQGVTRTEQVDAMHRIYRKALSMPDVEGAFFHRLIEPAGASADATDPGFAWLRAGTYPPEPYPVFCSFAGAAGYPYPGC